jgi:hypothetical protein
MEQNYFDKKHFVNGPRPLVIKRILAYSKYYNQKKKEFKDLEKSD